jgi:hypothetical protein
MIFHLPAILSDVVIGSPPRSGVRNPYGDPALAFVLTVLIEWPLLAWFSGLGLRRTGLFCLLMNGMTWGVAMGVLARWPVPVPAIEAAVLVAEAALLAAFWRWSWRRALPVSIGLNLASWGLGTAIFKLLLHYR